LTGRTKHFYVNPQRPNSDDALKVHGITDEFLADKPLFAAVVDELTEFLRDAEILIHNAPFDVSFMDIELGRIGRASFISHVAKVTDTLSMAREMFPGKSNSLDALCRRLEVDNSNRALHGALLDAGLLAETYIRMTRGQESLVIDVSHADSMGTDVVAAIDFAALELLVIEPSVEELAAHDALLTELDKACGGRTLWRAHGIMRAPLQGG
jgi:DNA polymerase-3 subunit epsilon